MIKPIIHNRKFLSEISIPATKDDIAIAQDMKDTLNFHKGDCVGMAANMIGEKKRIIVLKDEGEIMVMFNPEIINKERPYPTKEGCLSLIGQVTEVVRFDKIKVRYYNEHFKMKVGTYSGLSAQIIQHEIDHCDGILV